MLLLLLAACLAWLPPPGAAGERRAPPPRPEEYSPSRTAPRAGNSTGNAAYTTMRLSLNPPAARVGMAVPKTLPELQRATGDEFLCVQRGQFLVAGDLGLLDYEYLVDGVLDYCANALVRTFFDRGRVADKTVNIFVFKDYDSYETGLRRFFGMEPITPYGHYGHSQKYIVVNYETGPGTMVHELTHALMSEDFPEAPIWLSEGMASLYEHCRAEDGGLKGDDNWRLPELQAAMSKGTLGSVASLLAMSPDAFRSRNESLNYAQARYFCKYMEELGVLPRVYRELRGNSARDPTGEGAIVATFGKPMDVVEAAWRRWITFQYWRE
jgi:hypothetical protein